MRSFFGLQFEEAELIERIFSSHQSVAKKQDVFGIFTDWPRQEFDPPDAKNFQAVGVNEGQVIEEDRTVGESFGFCCPGVEPEFFAESTNALLFSLIFPMNINFKMLLH